MTAVRFTIHGVEAGARSIESRAASVDQAARMTLRMEGEAILADSQAIVPFDEGILSATGHVQGPRRTATGFEAMIGYGGPAKDYAIVQHEDTTLRHAEGREAKYLERPALDHARSFESRLTTAIRSALMRP